MRSRIALSLASVGLAALMTSSSAYAQGPITTTVTIPPTVVLATLYQSADGCQDTGRTVVIGIPTYQYLDQTFKDPKYNIPGLAFRELTKVGNSGIRDLKYEFGNFSFLIFASGGGSVQCVPFGGCRCTGASGGSYGVEVTAHYKPTTLQLQSTP
jgi:hypothetical protein